jgi:hypothetical protein
MAGIRTSTSIMAAALAAYGCSHNAERGSDASSDPTEVTEDPCEQGISTIPMLTGKCLTTQRMAGPNLVGRTRFDPL